MRNSFVVFSPLQSRIHHSNQTSVRFNLNHPNVRLKSLAWGGANCCSLRARGDAPLVTRAPGNLNINYPFITNINIKPSITAESHVLVDNRREVCHCARVHGRAAGPASQAFSVGQQMTDYSFDELLESFPQDSGSPSSPGGSPPEGLPSAPDPSNSILKRGISYSHDQMVDLIIGNPGISQGEIARRLGYSESWISQILNSDAFKSRLAERREALVDPSIREQVEKGFDALIQRSVEILQEKLQNPSNLVSDQLAIRTLEIASRARGYGARENPPPASVNIEMHLENLGGGLVNLLRRRKAETIDGTAEPAGSS